MPGGSGAQQFHPLSMGPLVCFLGGTGAKLVGAEPQLQISRLMQGDSLQGTCSTCLSGVSGSRLTVLGHFRQPTVLEHQGWLASGP